MVLFLGAPLHGKSAAVDAYGEVLCVRLQAQKHTYDVSIPIKAETRAGDPRADAANGSRRNQKPLRHARDADDIMPGGGGFGG